MIRSSTDATKTNILTSADAVLDAVGGTLAASKLTGASMSSISGWRKAGHLPARYFLVLQVALAELGLTAPAELWRIDEPTGWRQTLTELELARRGVIRGISAV